MTYYNLLLLLFCTWKGIDLTNKIQAVQLGPDGNFNYDQTWICALATSNQIKKRRVGIAILNNPKYLGPNAASVQFVILVLCPINEVNVFSILFFCFNFKINCVCLLLETARSQRSFRNWTDIRFFVHEQLFLSSFSNSTQSNSRHRSVASKMGRIEKFVFTNLL